MVRGLTFAAAVLAAGIVCNSCGKSESDQGAATPATGQPGASASTPTAPPTGMPPEWLQPALFGSFKDGGHERALQAILDVPDHPEQITAFARDANDSLCISLMFILSALADRTQDPKYVPVAAAVAKRLGELGESDSTMVVLMMYPPEIVGPQMLTLLNDDEAAPLDHCGVVNWVCDWHEREASSVAAIIDASEGRFGSLLDEALTHDDRDHGALGLNIIRLRRECGLVDREESLRLLDRWNAQYGHIASLRTLYDLVKETCERSNG